MAVWGTLTGIRPTKLVYKYLKSNHGATLTDAAAFLTREYLCSEERAQLAVQIVQNQADFMRFGDEYINLYIHIPFCPTKCRFCSFVSLPLTNAKNASMIDRYVDLLTREIEDAQEIIKRLNKKLLSVYVGGGTPTALDAHELKRVLKAIGIKGVEYTVEAGRPDTITPQKLSVMLENGVNRISVNPQSFIDSTLERIGRKHTCADTIRAFEWARELGFYINMDLIAGLPAETLLDFEKSLDTAMRLRPENITLHTLSIKNGSEFFLAGEGQNLNAYAQDMVDLAHGHLQKNGYSPYYLYRQKKMAANLENVGYCLNGRQSVNNITVMEETVSVLACGAGAISKRVVGGRIDRLPNVRDVGLYIEEFEKRLHLKNKFFSY